MQLLSMQEAQAVSGAQRVSMCPMGNPLIDIPLLRELQYGTGYLLASVINNWSVPFDTLHTFFSRTLKNDIVVTELADRVFMAGY